MKILLLSWRDPKHPNAGGAEISLMEHAKFWTKKGAKVTWFASSFKDANAQEKFEDVNIIRSGSHFTVHIKAFLYLFKNKALNFDIIIDCFHFVPYFTPLYLRNKKIIVWINEPAKNAWFKNIFFPVSLIGYLMEPLFFIPYRKLQFITSAESIKKELKNLGIKKIKIVPHGIKILKTKTVKKEKSPILIYLAAITKDKGIEDGIKAFEKVSREIKNAKLWIIGKASDSSYLEKLKVLISEKKLNKQITFFGFVTEQKKFELLQKAWILIHPSIREGWGLNIIEAAGVGTPSVGYNVVGLRDSIKNNHTGLLSATNPSSLADICLKLIKDKSLYKKLSANALKYSSQFSWKKSAEKSWRVINEKK